MPITLPATRVAVQTMDPMFVGLGRSVLAAHLAAFALILTRQPFPRGAVWKWLAIAAGADTLVAGTATFKGGPDQYAANIHALRGG